MDAYQPVWIPSLGDVIILFAAPEGEDSYQEWTKYPSNAQLVSAWKQIYGKTFIQEVS
jgi:hypothetical protein